MTLEPNEVLHCPDCRVWDPENQPSVLANLEKDEHFYDNEMFWTIPNGMRLSGPGFDIPLWTEFKLCPRHKAEATI